jgi:murein DD-endopeptidase MepM/ murein hydrolase activator NlpD
MPDWWNAIGPPAPAAAAPAPGGGEDVEGYIRQAASKRGIDPETAIKVAQSEGGLVPNKTGVFKTGQSFWPYQLHYGGPGYETFGNVAGMGNSFTAQTGYQPGDPTAWKAATDYALDAAAKNGWGAWYGARNVGVTGYQGINRSGGATVAPPAAAPARATPAQAPAAPTGQTGPTPAWYAAIPGARDASYQYERDEGPGVQPLPNAQPSGAGGWQQLVDPRGGAVAASGAPQGPVTRPLAGNVITHAGQNYWSFGGGPHAGIDIAAKAGTPVRTPVAGEVVANLAAGQNPLGLSAGYGRAVAVRDPGGDVHIFGHGAPDFGYLPVGTKVNVGDVVSTVGSPKTKLPGEATEGEHLHWEIRGGGDYGKQINPEQWLPKQTVPATNTPRKAITTEPGPAWWSAV